MNWPNLIFPDWLLTMISQCVIVCTFPLAFNGSGFLKQARKKQVGYNLGLKFIWTLHSPARCTMYYKNVSKLQVGRPAQFGMPLPNRSHTSMNK